MKASSGENAPTSAASQAPAPEARQIVAGAEVLKTVSIPLRTATAGSRVAGLLWSIV
jgi:hypothetical protein